MSNRPSCSKKTIFLIGLFLPISLWFLNVDLWSSRWSVQSSDFLRSHVRPQVNRADYPKEAFVTFTNAHSYYIELLDVLLDSVHLFSTRPVIIFSVDFDLTINRTRHPRALVERLAESDCGQAPFGCKLLAMISSEVHYGVQLEVDAVVNHHVDLLFDMLHVWPYDVPLAPKHPNDPLNYREYMAEYDVKSRSTPYMHGTFAWTHRAYPFLRQVFGLMQRGAFSNANVDETAMNVMLWKAKANHTLCKYDPFGPIAIDKYEENAPACTDECDGVYLVFHGQKRSLLSRDILQRLSKLGANRPIVQTPHGLRWLNETNVTCCHPSAARPSALHPLLCEYHRYDAVPL